MAVLISDVTNALQKVIMPYIKDNLPKEVVFLDQMKRNAGVTFMNNAFYAPIRSGRHGGVANLATDDSSVVSSKSTIGQGSVGVKIITGAFNISKLTIDATKTTKGAVESMLTFQAESLVNDFKRSLNRQFYSDGVGIVSQVQGSVGAGTVSLEAPDADGYAIDDSGEAWYGTINDDIAENKYLAAGQILGIGSAGADLGTVTSVTGTSVVMTGSPASVANYPIYIMDGSGAGAGSSEIQGVRLALKDDSTGTYAGVGRTTAGWTAQTGTISEALTMSKMESKYLAAREYGMAGDRYAIFVNKTLYKKYGDILTAMRRVVNEAELLGGWTGLEFAAGAGRVGVFLDYDVPDGEVLIINLDSWTICQVSDIDWMEDPASGNLLRIADKLHYQAIIHWFLNLICLCPAANARLVRKTD